FTSIRVGRPPRSEGWLSVGRSDYSPAQRLSIGRIQSVGPDASWSFEPGVLLLVLAIAAAYIQRWRRAGTSAERRRVSFGRLALFGCGLLAIVAALISPIDVLGEQLMLMHM